MTIPYALSIHHFISSVGADAGFAAIIGLALLVLLLFAQARETASLRQRTLDAEENLQRLELYVDQIARRPATPAPGPIVTPAPASARAAVPAGAGVGAPVAAARPSEVGIPAGDRMVIPYAPAGVGAPALAAATRLIPGPDPISIRSLRAPDGEPVSVGAPVSTPAIAAGTMTPDRPAPAPAAPSAAPPARAAVTPPLAPFPPPPSTPAAGGNGVASRSPSGADELPPVRVRLYNGEHAGSGRELPPLRRGGQVAGSDERPRIGRGVIAAAAVLAAAIVVVVVLVVTGGGSTGATATQGASGSATTRTATKDKASSKRRHGAVASGPAPATITVAVLNGTNTTNLAHDVMSKLSTLGYKQGGAETATDQTVTLTIVSYLPGYRAQALVVAKSLGLSSSSVQAVSQSNQSVACSASATPCADQVVVDVGTDLNSYAAAASSSSSSAAANGTATSGA